MYPFNRALKKPPSIDGGSFRDDALLYLTMTTPPRVPILFKKIKRYRALNL